MAIMGHLDYSKTHYATKINTSHGWQDSPCISPDGQTLWFMYSRYNFFPIFTGGNPRLIGPMRLGHHVNDANPFDDSDIYYATKQPNGSWSAPLNWAGNGFAGDSSMMLIQGPPQRMYMTGPGVSGSSDVGYKEYNSGTQTWGSFVPLGTNVNSAGTEDNPFVTAAQDRIWFTSDRAGGSGGKDIWTSTFSGGIWQPAVNAGAVINSTNDEDQFYLNESTGDVFFNRQSQIYHSTWNGSVFTTPSQVSLNSLPFVAEASCPLDMSKLYFASTDTTNQSITIMVCNNIGGGLWSTPTPVD